MNLSQIVANGFHKTFTGSDVTITEAKMKACEEFLINGKAVTKRKQNALWGRDIPCDGITNAASTSIDTGIKAVDNIEMLVRVKAITGSFYILQARNTGTATIYGISGSQNGNTIVCFGVTSGITRTDGHIYTIKVTYVSGAVTVYVKDETTGTEDTKTGTVTDYTFPSQTTIKLFGDASKVDAGVTVYRAYIKVNGQMAWDMYPAVDVNNSNAPVAYDDVTHAPSVKLSGSITGGNLIQPISFAESDGTAWGDTGHIGSEKTKITIDFQKTINTKNYMHTAGNSATKTAAISCNIGIGDDTLSRFGAESENLHLFNDLNRHNLIIANDGYIADGTNVWTPNASAFTTSDNILLLTPTRVAIDRFIGKVYAVSIAEEDALVRDYIPVRIGTTVELLDLVNWTYATRTGTFTAGPDIPYGQLCPDIIETNVGDALYGEYGDNLVSFTRKDAVHLDANFTNGKIASNNDRTALFIPVTGGKTYSFLVSDTLKSAGWYLVQITADVPEIGTDYAIDGTSTFVNRKGYSDYTMVTDPRTKWIGISISESKASTPTFFNQQFMMVEGATVPTAIVPRQTGLHPSGEQRVVIQPKNLADISAAVLGDINGTTGGINTSVTYRIVTDFIAVENGVTYVGNAELITTDGTVGTGYSVIIAEYDASKQIIPDSRRAISSRKFTITDSTTAYVRVEYYCTNIVSGKTIDPAQSWILLEIGETSTFWEPYSPAQIRTIKTFLLTATSFVDAQKASNNCSCDWKFLALTGQETGWSMHASLAGLFFLSLASEGALVQPTYDNYGECNKYTAVRKTAGSISNGECCFQALNESSNARFAVRTPYTSVNEIKEVIKADYDAGNPWIIAFPVATPIVTTVTINPVTLANGTNRVTASSGTVKVTANVRVI